MLDSLAPALRVLGYFWLEEVRPDDAETIALLPDLADTLPDYGPDTLDLLAVEYQRLFGFNLPPYESVFIDPSVMLMAPATHLVQQLYQEGGWEPPTDSRAGAPDHLGFELLALADWLEAGQTDLADQLQGCHLALWVPPFMLALTSLKPHPFYQAIADLTLNLLVSTLPDDHAAVDPATLFPELPPPPVYRASQAEPEESSAAPEADTRLRAVVKKFLPPRQAGLFITRQDLALIRQSLDLPPAVGDRYHMLEGLFRLAGQYELGQALIDQLEQLLTKTGRAYQSLAEEYPNWQPYALAWQQRLSTTQTLCAELRQAMHDMERNYS